ncbi:hypothetical protein [Gordonia sp. VNK21]|uniref:hypothetical protein n=1 Tax=Gordonia sp. VNK21 TaxID=3382483 RepID=UPI0038D4E923
MSQRQIILTWIVIVIAVLLTITSIIGLSTGSHGFAVWAAVICWPIVAILSVVKLSRND